MNKIAEFTNEKNILIEEIIALNGIPRQFSKGAKQTLSLLSIDELSKKIVQVKKDIESLKCWRAAE